MTLHEKLLRWFEPGSDRGDLEDAIAHGEAALRLVVKRHTPVQGLGGMVCLRCRHPWGDPVEAPCDESLIIATALGIETGDHR